MKRFSTHKTRWDRPLKEQYDAVVIGAGIGGMSSAIALAEKGASVLLVDKHIVPGGCCSAFYRRGYIFDAAVHNLAGGSRYTSFGRMLQRLGVEIEMYELDPVDTIVLPEKEVCLPALVTNMRKELSAHFPHEKEGIKSFFRTFQKLYRSLSRNLPEDQDLYTALMDKTFGDIVSDHIKDPICQKIIGGQWPYLAVPPNKLAAIEGIITLGSYLIQGAYYPKGGMQALANTFLERFEALGGHTLLRCNAERIVYEENQIVGVELSKERFARTKCVISNVDPTILFGLLGEDSPLSPLQQELKTMQPSPSAFLLYIGLDESADLSSLPWGFYFQDNYESLDDWMFVSKPTLKDPSLAPNNGQILATMLGYGGPLGPNIDWKAQKAHAAERILKRLEARSPGLRDHIVISATASPSTIQRYTGNHHGHMYGWTSNTSHSGTRRPGYTTALPGLYLTGHWTRPGSGVPAVTLSGLQTADEALPFLETHT
ncbi:MAG: hypothetical protein CL920_14850 [Deltaproteobacteria bacterium]|nr:hypothetical protein [Deltaproteobacteria bacterium]|tara:strand:- start:292 stop:1749 length:1458 start_codon:yes stop_codon:yes gene_type:complete